MNNACDWCNVLHQGLPLPNLACLHSKGCRLRIAVLLFRDSLAKCCILYRGEYLPPGLFIPYDWMEFGNLTRSIGSSWAPTFRRGGEGKMGWRRRAQGCTNSTWTLPGGPMRCPFDKCCHSVARGSSAGRLAESSVRGSRQVGAETSTLPCSPSQPGLRSGP